MALIVEAGSGLSNGESYASVATADAYHAARGNDAWDAVDNKEAALRNATDYMVQAYRMRWAGYRKFATQALDWPRYEAPMTDSMYGNYYDSGSIPAAVVNACCALALKAAAGDLSPDLAPRVTSESVGPISVTYAADGRQTTVYRAIDSMLQDFFKSSCIMLVRS